MDGKRRLRSVETFAPTPTAKQMGTSNEYGSRAKRNFADRCLVCNNVIII